MNRLHYVWVPLLVAFGLLAYKAYQRQVDNDVVAAVVVFLIVAAVVNTFVYRLSRKHGW